MFLIGHSVSCLELSAYGRSGLWFGRSHRVLGGLGKPELHGRLGLDFDRLPGGRITPHPGRVLRLHQLAQAWDRELAQLPGGTCSSSAMYRMTCVLVILVAAASPPLFSSPELRLWSLSSLPLSSSLPGSPLGSRSWDKTV